MFEVTVNSSIDEPFSIKSWTINDYEQGAEYSRVGVSSGLRHYAIVLKDGEPTLEIWSLDERGELFELEKSVNLTELEEMD